MEGGGRRNNENLPKMLEKHENCHNNDKKKDRKASNTDSDTVGKVNVKFS